MKKSVEVKKISGSTLEKIKYVAKGSYGEVFEGLLEGKPVAAKMLTGELDEKVIQEAIFLQQCNHPNIISLLGIVDDDIPTIVTEYMDCGNVLNFLRSPYADWTACLEIALETAMGLQYLHSLNLIHGDLKSLNILLNSDGEVKICDFGSAVIEDEKQLGALSGTVIYSAEELYQNEPMSFQSDIYSFGVFLGELISRESPKLGQSDYSGPHSKAKSIPELLEFKQKGIMHRAFSISQLDLSERTDDRIYEQLLKLHQTCIADKASRPQLKEIIGILSNLIEKLDLTLKTALKDFHKSLTAESPFYSASDQEQKIKIRYDSLASLYTFKNGELILPYRDDAFESHDDKEGKKLTDLPARALDLPIPSSKVTPHLFKGLFKKDPLPKFMILKDSYASRLKFFAHTLFMQEPLKPIVLESYAKEMSAMRKYLMTKITKYSTQKEYSSKVYENITSDYKDLVKLIDHLQNKINSIQSHHYGSGK